MGIGYTITTITLYMCITIFLYIYICFLYALIDWLMRDD